MPSLESKVTMMGPQGHNQMTWETEIHKVIRKMKHEPYTYTNIYTHIQPDIHDIYAQHIY